MDLQILVSTMHQEGLNIVKRMNICSDVIIANQADHYQYNKTKIDDFNVTMITTNQRGLNKNRNTTLLHASGDICLFADDDVTYYDDYYRKILDAFIDLPDADVILFNLDSYGDCSRNMMHYKKITRAHYFTRIGVASYRIAFRLKSVQKKNIWISPIFSTGSKYYCGEDAMFINDCIKNGLKVYLYPATIGKVNRSGSTWFDGLNEKYYFTKGAYIRAVYRKMYFIFILYYIIRGADRSEMKLFEKFLWIKNGMYAFDNDLSYDEYFNMMFGK